MKHKCVVDLMEVMTTSFQRIEEEEEKMQDEAKWWCNRSFVNNQQNPSSARQFFSSRQWIFVTFCRASPDSSKSGPEGIKWRQPNGRTNQRKWRKSMRLKWEGKGKEDGNARGESNDALPEDVCKSATPNVANISTEALVRKSVVSIWDFWPFIKISLFLKNIDSVCFLEKVIFTMSWCWLVHESQNFQRSNRLISLHSEWWLSVINANW